MSDIFWISNLLWKPQKAPKHKIFQLYFHKVSVRTLKPEMIWAGGSNKYLYYLIVLAVNMKTDPSGLTSSPSGETPPTTYRQTSRPPTSLQSLPSSIGRKISPILTLPTFYYHNHLRRVSSNILYIGLVLSNAEEKHF